MISIKLFWRYENVFTHANRNRWMILNNSMKYQYLEKNPKRGSKSNLNMEGIIDRVQTHEKSLERLWYGKQRGLPSFLCSKQYFVCYLMYCQGT